MKSKLLALKRANFCDEGLDDFGLRFVLRIRRHDGAFPDGGPAFENDLGQLIVRATGMKGRIAEVGGLRIERLSCGPIALALGAMTS